MPPRDRGRRANIQRVISGTAHLEQMLDAYRVRTDAERRDVARVRALSGPGAWSRSSALHVTGSAVVVHPPTRSVLLRWHERMQSWLQVGGHADPGETDPFAIARREAREETGLADLVAWPDAEHPTLVHAVVVPVPAGAGEGPHEHADLRFVLATEQPDAIVEESAHARLRWLTLDDAIDLAAEDNLRTTLVRVGELFVSV
jgi:8-oxo-dGTP pyrophosphatase MutT (NUDIX family)